VKGAPGSRHFDKQHFGGPALRSLIRNFGVSRRSALSRGHFNAASLSCASTQSGSLDRQRMKLILYAHPFSSYCWKALIALWENEIAFDYRSLEEPAHQQAWAQASPFKRMPLLIDGKNVVHESTIIIEYLQIHYPGRVTLIPAEPQAALDVRLLDRLSDNYLMGSTQTIVFNEVREEKDRDPYGVAKARGMLDDAYAWWNDHMKGREWAANAFSLADCATGPALFYADWAHPIPEKHAALRAYRTRLLARPSMARAVDEARPFRSHFPFGDPGRD
jgi:glutathione S-transferase